MRRQERLIDKADYEKLCRQACDEFQAHCHTNKNEEVVLLAICREAYDYFGEEFVLTPVSADERLEVYWNNLLELMSTRQSEKFSVLEITGKYINEVLNKPASRT